MNLSRLMYIAVACLGACGCGGGNSATSTPPPTRPAIEAELDTNDAAEPNETAEAHAATTLETFASGESGPLTLLITLDTTRADHLGCYGYERPTSPNLDRLAADSMVYERAIAPGTWTLTSHASLFTGKFVSSHGARMDPQRGLPLSLGVCGPSKILQQLRASTISPHEQTLASILHDAGFVTGAIVGGPWMKTEFGLQLGFDHYDDQNIEPSIGRLAEDVTSKALQWLSRPEVRHRFLFLNYFDPHYPLVPPEEFMAKFLPEGEVAPNGADGKLSDRQMRDLYDAEILYTDAQLGRLLDGLQQLGLYEDAWIVVTADHGDSHGEHEVYEHGRTPYQEVVHIPLIVKTPGAATTGRSAKWIQLTDVLPMLLDGLQISPPAGIQGRSPPDIGHPIVIESHTIDLPGTMFGHQPGHWLCLIEPDGTKAIWNSEGHHMLFDLNSDPHEEHNLIDEHTEKFMALSKRLQNYLADLPRPAEVDSPTAIKPETLKALKSLGYTK